MPAVWGQGLGRRPPSFCGDLPGKIHFLPRLPPYHGLEITLPVLILQNLDPQPTSEALPGQHFPDLDGDHQTQMLPPTFTSTLQEMLFVRGTTKVSLTGLRWHPSKEAGFNPRVNLQKEKQSQKKQRELTHAKGGVGWALHPSPIQPNRATSSPWSSNPCPQLAKQGPPPIPVRGHTGRSHTFVGFSVQTPAIH